MGKTDRKAVIAISSHVARGSVGNRAAVFALELMGHPVWSVPTILLPWHPGHGPATRIIPGETEFAAFLDDIGRAPWRGEIAGVLSGYLGAASQVEPIRKLVVDLKRENPSILFACDPVIGDIGGLYVAEETAAAIRDRLLPLADIATPNRFELAWLTGLSAGTPQPAQKVARRLGPARVLVTSVEAGTGTGNMLVTPQTAVAARHAAVDGAPNGLGDLTSALFFAHILSGRNDRDSLADTTASVFAMLQRTLTRGADELTLETDADCLLCPPAGVFIRSID